jgi:large subunit ribosomal protein L9
MIAESRIQPLRSLSDLEREAAGILVFSGRRFFLMKVILKEDIPKLGRMGETVQVAPGYGRNYLIPQGKALLATDRNVKALEHERSLIQRKADFAREEAEGLAGKISGLSLTLTRKVVDEDKLYGSVSVSDISQALEESGVAIERKLIKLDEPIRSLGEFQVPIKVHADVTAEITVQVIKEE